MCGCQLMFCAGSWGLVAGVRRLHEGVATAVVRVIESQLCGAEVAACRGQQLRQLCGNLRTQSLNARLATTSESRSSAEQYIS
jgi:hypothetical protein